MHNRGPLRVAVVQRRGNVLGQLHEQAVLRAAALHVQHVVQAPRRQLLQGRAGGAAGTCIWFNLLAAAARQTLHA